MIECFEGRIGGGKTLSAVERMVMTWVSNGLVATNVDIIWDACCYSGNGGKMGEDLPSPFRSKPRAPRLRPGWHGCKEYALRCFGVWLDDRQFITLDGAQCSRFWEHVPAGTPARPVLIVIDEADVWIGNQTTGVKVAPEMFTFLKQSRKMCNDIIFITQALKNLSSQVARLVQYIWRFRDMRKFKLPVIGGVFPWPFIMQNQLDYTGEPMESKLRRINPELYKCYRTDALHSVFKRLEGFDAKAVQARVVRRKGWWEADIPGWVLAVLVVVLVYVLVWL